jgi:hypothetical protein
VSAIYIYRYLINEVNSTLLRRAAGRVPWPAPAI